jgi:excinuclease ABC subunit C
VITEKLKNIPQFPGCYLFKDDKDQIIYVGMSKFLPKRVTSYFQKNHDNQKTKYLVEQIKDVDFVITSSEQEAILMEEELIKVYKPKFNIKGKDDKTRKWSICITDERFPKLEIVRNNTDNRDSLDFTSGLLCREVYNLIHDIIDLRSCSYDLTQENIDKGKFKICLEYQMMRCSGPCVNKITEIIYQSKIQLVKKIFELDLKYVENKLKKLVKYHSDKLEFEIAGNLHSKVEMIKELESKVETIRIRKSNKNAFELKKLLNLNNVPLIIEGFDNSHNQGDSNVAASVRFINEIPNKNDYRKYNIKSFQGIDDYASFDEILNRRFGKLIKEKQQLPNLVLIDGGKGQLNVAIKVFERLGILNKVDLISVSKDSNHKSSIVHTIDGKTHSILSNTTFTILGKVQEEVHRFVINFHRQKQSKKLLN